MSRTPARFTQADVAREIATYKASTAKKTAEAPTFIYFLRAGEFVKIGHSRRWKVRLDQMQIGSPYTIVPLLVLIGTPAMERKLHARFRADHFRGEWFHIGPAVRAFIKANITECLANSDVSEIDLVPEEDLIF